MKMQRVILRQLSQQGNNEIAGGALSALTPMPSSLGHAGHAVQWWMGIGRENHAFLFS